MEAVSHLTSVEDFSTHLEHVSITDRGLAYLSNLKKIKTIDIRSNEMTDDGLKALAGLDKLERLTLRGLNIHGPGLKHLEGLRNLHELDISCACDL